MKRFVRPLVCLHHSGRRTTSVKNNDQTPGVTNNNDVRPSVWRPLPPQKKALLTALGRTEQYLSSALKNGRFSWIEAPRGKEVYVLNFPHEAIPLKILYFMKTYIHLWSHRPGAWQWKGACAGRCTPGERLKKQILIFADICQENFLIVVRTALLYSFLSLFKGKSFPTSVITTPCLIRKNAWSIFRSFLLSGPADLPCAGSEQMNKVEIGICNPVTALQNPRDICNPAIALQNPGMKELQNRIFWKKRPKPDRPGEIKRSTIENSPKKEGKDI